MAVFLFWMSPEPGHILPTLEVAQELRRRGHRTVYYAYSRIERELADLGFETVSGLRNVPAELLNASITRRTEPSVAAEMRMEGLFKTRRQYHDFLRNDLLEVIRDVGPDVLITDGIKDWRFTEGCPEFYQNLLRHIKILRLCVHLRRLTVWDFSRPEIPLVILCPESFELPALVDSRVIYAEASRFTRTGTSPSKHNKTHGSCRSIYVTFGSQIAEYNGVRAALNEILLLSTLEPEWSFVLNIESASPGLSTEYPNVSRAEFTSHLDALNDAAAIICHGGLGTIKDAIDTKTPMIVIPQLWDQPLNARRVVYHRIGLAAEGARISADWLATAVRSISSSNEIERGIRLMHDEFENRRRLRVAAAACERVL